MDIPTDIPRRINPDIQDPISKSVVYTFDTRDLYFDKDGNIIYNFPYSKNTYWTNFKYTCYNITKNETEDLEIGLELNTSDNYQYEIIKMQTFENKTVYDTVWPIPSVNTVGRDAAVYFKIKYPSEMQSKYSIVVSLIGFTDLFPKVENYLLLSSLDTYQFIFCKYEQDDIPESRGSIWNVEHYDYIREIMSKACGIRLIKRY
jgi:hypothetical protein